MKKIRIITSNSPGLLNDAKTYGNIFKKNNYIVDIFLQELNYPEKKNQEKYDINFFLEHIIPNNYTDIFPSILNIFMPNQELFITFNELSKINYILCKSKLALTYFKYIKKEKKYNYTCYYTKFTTNIPKEIKNKTIIKNKNLFVHFAGKSSMKGTDSLVYCWMKNNGFLHIDPNIELHITCYRTCFKKMKKNLKEYHNFDFFLKSENDLIKYKNLYLHVIPISDELYKKFLVEANVSICTSTQEGYGHYINEARYFETFILSLDHPPMNELVKNEKNGILIDKLDKEKKEWLQEYTSYPLYKVYPNIEQLKEKLIYCIKNKDNLHILGKNGKNMFLKDKRYFKKKMNVIINNVLSVKLK
jgi:glycosyltransferase involved in cell wall biosynthesis